MPGLLGSAVGIGLGGLAVGAIGDDRAVHAAVLFSIFSLVHAGITTLFVVKCRAVCGRRAVSAGRVDGPTAAGHR